jgi:hypothetical protein
MLTIIIVNEFLREEVKSIEKPKVRIVRTLDRIGAWTFLTGSAAVLALNLWSLVVTVGELLGGVPPRGESLGEQVAKSGYPAAFEIGQRMQRDTEGLV